MKPPVEPPSDIGNVGAAAPAWPPRREAETELIRALRAEVQERIKLQQQITVVAGGSIAVAATLLGDRQSPSPWLLLGLSVLFIAFGFSILNQERLIVTAVHFILGLENPHAEVQAEWETHLHTSNRTLGLSLTGVGAGLRAMGTYAIPLLGAVGASWAFLASGEAQRPLVALPAAMVFAFLIESWRILHGYQRLSHIEPKGTRGLGNS